MQKLCIAEVLISFTLSLEPVDGSNSLPQVPINQPSQMERKNRWVSLSQPAWAKIHS